MSSAEIWAQHARYALEKAREEVAAAKREVKRGGPGAAYRLVQAQRDLRALTTKKRNPEVGLSVPPGWRLLTATNDGYRELARVMGNVEMKIDGFTAETCNRLGLPVVWNWRASIISGKYREKAGTAPALLLAVSRAETAAKGLQKGRSNPKRKNPRDPFAGVRRAIEKEVARFVAEGPSGFNKRGRNTWGRLMDSAYAVYEKYRVESDGAVLLPVETVTAEIQAAEERARVLRREHNEKEMHEAEREHRYQQFQRDRERGYR